MTLYTPRAKIFTNYPQESKQSPKLMIWQGWKIINNPNKNKLHPVLTLFAFFADPFSHLNIATPSLPYSHSYRGKWGYVEHGAK
jgi:hypothetical protein